MHSETLHKTTLLHSMSANDCNLLLFTFYTVSQLFFGSNATAENEWDESLPPLFRMGEKNKNLKNLKIGQVDQTMQPASLTLPNLQ